RIVGSAPNQRAQHLDPRPVGRCSDSLPDASPGDDMTSVAGDAHQLVREPALADARLAAEQDHPTLPCLRVREGAAELVELALPPNESRGRSVGNTRPPPPRS